MNVKDKIAELQRQPENYGYVVFGSDRFKEMEPKSKGDEFRCGSQWLEPDEAFGFYVAIYRRPVDPGEGFELVGLDDKEIITWENDFTIDGKEWGKCHMGWFGGTVKELLEIAPQRPFEIPFIILAIRRRKVCAVCGGDKQVASKHLDYGAAYGPVSEPCPACQPKTLGADGPLASSKGLEMLTEMAQGSMHVLASRSPAADKSPGQFGWKSGKDTSSNSGGSLEHRKVIAKGHLDLALYLIAQERLVLVLHCAKFDFIEMTPEERKKWDDADKNQQPPGEWIDVAKELPVFPGSYATIEECQIEYNWFKPLNKWSGKVTHWWKWNDSLIPPPPVI